MLDVSEIRLVLIVGVHTIANALGTGDSQKAVVTMLYAVGCYLGIMGCVVISNKVFGEKPTEAKPKTPRRKTKTRVKTAAVMPKKLPVRKTAARAKKTAQKITEV